MGLETFGFINSLDADNPVPGDAVSQGDEHLRGIKATLLAQFPALAAAVTADASELNKLDGILGDLVSTQGNNRTMQTGLHLNFAIPSATNSWTFNFATHNAAYFVANSVGAVSLSLTGCAAGRWALIFSSNQTTAERNIVPTGDNGYTGIIGSLDLTLPSISPSLGVHLVVCLDGTALYAVSLI